MDHDESRDLNPMHKIRAITKVVIHLDSSKLNLSTDSSFRSSDRCTVLDKNSHWKKEWYRGGDVLDFKPTTLPDLQSMEY